MSLRLNKLTEQLYRSKNIILEVPVSQSLYFWQHDTQYLGRHATAIAYDVSIKTDTPYQLRHNNYK